MDPQRKRMKPDREDDESSRGNSFLCRRRLSTPPPPSPPPSPPSAPPATDESPKRLVRARRARWLMASSSNQDFAARMSSRRNFLGESSGETLSTSSLASIEPLENNYFNVDRNKNVITFDDSFHDLIMTDDEDGGSSQSSSRSLHCTPPPVLKREKSLLKKKQCPPTPCPSSGSNQCRRISLFGRNEQRSHNASIVSFKPEEDAPALSPLYSPNRKKEDYLNQTFIVGERIGSGSFGEVFRAVSKDDSQQYAIKVMRSPFRNNARRALVLEEVRKHELLPEHPNLVGFVSAWEEQDRLFIQTELCTKSLANMCNHDHYISEDRVWKYFVDILFAVHHLHVNNIIHVDIKPDNIFLTTDDTCKLGDFGLSFDVLHDDVRSLDEGDCRYLAPEVLNHRPTRQADIYSMGITVFELATDMDLPQRGRYWVYIRQGRVQRRFLDKIPISLKHVIYAMMNPQPSLRPTTIDLLMNERVRNKMTKVQEQVFNEYHTGKKTVQQSSTFSGFWDYLKSINNFFKR